MCDTRMCSLMTPSTAFDRDLSNSCSDQRDVKRAGILWLFTRAATEQSENLRQNLVTETYQFLPHIV
jgi:hypothetical protein